MPDNIRSITLNDLNAIKTVIDTNGLFPSELLDGMLSDYFTNPETNDIWLTNEIDDTPIGIAYCAPEKFTIGTFNLYLIAIHKDFQGEGIGGKLIDYLENLLKSKGARILLVETSSLPEFELTRKFYDKCNYNREAVIRDFYNKGEDKVVFWKRLTK